MLILEVSHRVYISLINSSVILIFLCCYVQPSNSFLDIQQIENLWQLKNLCKLRLDNNIISSITGLEQLVNLEWLG